LHAGFEIVVQLAMAQLIYQEFSAQILLARLNPWAWASI